MSLCHRPSHYGKAFHQDMGSIRIHHPRPKYSTTMNFARKTNPYSLCVAERSFQDPIHTPPSFSRRLDQTQAIHRQAGQGPKAPDPSPVKQLFPERNTIWSADCHSLLLPRHPLIALDAQQGRVSPAPLVPILRAMRNFRSRMFEQTHHMCWHTSTRTFCRNPK